MSSSSWALTEDLSPTALVVVAVVALLSLALLVFELRSRERAGVLIVVSGLAAVLLTAMAIVRPVRVSLRGSVVGPRVVVLIDESRRMALPAERGTRREVAARVVEALRQRFADARLSISSFGEGEPRPYDASPDPSRVSDSDLSAAIAHLAADAAERPRAVVVVSDGRLTRPPEGSDDRALERGVGGLNVPLHTVRVAERAPADASVRVVRAAGAAVAHQPLALTLEIGCSGGLGCDEIPVAVRELASGVVPTLLASGRAKVEEGRAKLELSITLERAGTRIVEIAIDAPDGDTVPDNDRRILAFSVARERLRLLHVAGRPTYDVRALRMWLKSDESVDLVAFFILRTDTDDPGTDDDSELALIPFPVDELFTEHLPSFDAVVLQDIDAIRYKLAQHLPALSSYVERGGGLIMVGGPSSFAGGSYAGTALDRVLPAAMPESDRPFDTVEFRPRITEAGRAAPVLQAVRELYRDELPSFPGSNTLGEAKSGALVLWEHPSRQSSGRPMPVLALGEAGDGRAIALAVDGTYRLAWGELAARVGGRGYGALWDGLIGWLMRDPRYESARVELARPCISGLPTTLRVTRLPGSSGPVEVRLERLGQVSAERLVKSVDAEAGAVVEVPLGDLEPGGYGARVHVGAAPPTRFDFACERGGDAWSDSRPDPDRLEAIARITGGRSVTANDVASLPLPDATRIAAERHVTPLLPPWVWSLAAALALGAHWYARRRGGLS